MGTHGKKKVRSSLKRFTRADLQARIEESLLSATKEVWDGAVRHSRAFEDAYWSTDNIHKTVDPIVINIESDDEEDLFFDSYEDCE